MAEKTLNDISEIVSDMDICMLSSISKGEIISRPMSNNGDVEYDGNSYFFTSEETEIARDISTNPQVNLAFSDTDNQVYISVSGIAKLVSDKSKMEEHWVDELEQWFEDGIDTPGIVMIHVDAKKIKYWDNDKEGEVKLEN
ncbi:MAG: pyridoxamine 5'-phosphate oxidase family protein [Chitinophagales bacterium]|nr:pyridoxamine 5'-phosphate oxidase family protein [Chitinophagales bacterium]